MLESSKRLPERQALCPMKVPVPNEKEILAFQDLYEQKFSEKLSFEEARDAATRLLQLFFLTSHAIYSLRQKE